jgi:mono/diheme cytochrome c family protein
VKPIVKWLLVPVGVVVALAAGGVSYLFAAFPKAPAPDGLKVQATPELLERGQYLANHVTVCMDCHAERDWSLFSGPPKPGTLGHGGEHFTREMGLPGDFYSRNITPGGIGGWSDGELARAITTGVTKDGRAMFPIMPYTYFRHLCDRDLKAVIAYVRTLPGTGKTHPQTELDFPVNLIVRTIPESPEPWDCNASAAPERGKYLTTVAGCPECHTKQEKGRVVGERFAGGWRFPLPKGGGHITSKNITPDPETGIGKWTKEQFVETFRSRGKPGGAFPVKPGERQTLMPWNMYGGMTAEDLGAIYDYLRTVPAVKNQVAEFEPG